MFVLPLSFFYWVQCRQDKMTRKRLFLGLMMNVLPYSCTLIYNMNAIDTNAFLYRPKGDVFQIAKTKDAFPMFQGDIITIAFNSFKKNKTPVDPVIICKREDLCWDDVMKYNKAVALNRMHYIISISLVHFHLIFFSCLAKWWWTKATRSGT